ncbi:prolyl oligopeptidase family serine peptidase [Streptomyces sp. RS10V-4]|uniref:S9 family peptidase n=1 Tax=Streptomyces rhizoryzae TaxID=2932493 RepID=UPI00200692F0|nr:prolyl oligopeptidase family serine peptidase [Streptomyces rhizoryzae]MCK7627567.1 prolyl oligopeptidase family serine peptidase [Streptomyces rhizoryzae]
MTGQLPFPRHSARTQRFTLGAPRDVALAPDGSRVVFLRSPSGTDRSHRLQVLDLDSGKEFTAADPRTLLAGADEELPPEERARRERSREGSAGIVGYAVDAAVELAAFTLSGRLFVSELRAGTTRELPAAGPVVDPRPSPDGRRVAYVAGGALRVVAADGGGDGGPAAGDADRALAEPDGPGVTWGLAEFIAAEEMSRHRGFWWSPQSDRLLAARVDESPVARWWIADPAHPDREPAQVAYPVAGSANAEVTLALIGLDGSRTDVSWDTARYPYLARVHWSAAGPPLLLVQTRDQRAQRYLMVDTATGATTVVHEDEDPVWVEPYPGVPAWTPDGRLVRIADEGGVRKLFAGDRPLTGEPLHVRAVLDIGEDDVLFSASGPDTHDIGVYRAWFRGSGDQGGWQRLGGRPYPTVSSAVRSGELTVLTQASLEWPGTRTEVVRPGPDGGAEVVATLGSYAETPGLTARPRLVRAGEREIPCAVLLPSGYREGDGPLPVLMDPYGGPHGQRVVAAHHAHLTSQWFADQGFAVVVADGRGTPGRSPGWEKAVSRRLGPVALEDQVAALRALAGSFPLDLGRVAIRGWSFGGYLAALAALRRPDVFHAAVVGAPVTDLRLYDTHYQERYLGHPDEEPAVYALNSLVTDEGLSGAVEPHRPMLIVHGLADDNVVVAHSLRLSSALLAAGRPHEVLPLSGVTHMASQEQVAENLLLLQVDFLKRSLGLV